MEHIEKKNVKLSAAGALPEVHLRVSSLVEAVYRLVLRTPARHPLGPRGEPFKVGDLGDDPVRFPDDHVVNFSDGALSSAEDLNGCVLTAVINFAAQSDALASKVDLAVYLTQDGKYVPNGTAAHTKNFSIADMVMIDFYLVA